MSKVRRLSGKIQFIVFSCQCSICPHMMYKCTHSQQPPYLASLFPLPSSHHQHFTRSSSTVNLPPVHSSFGKRAFSFAGASLWRTLPPAIRNEKSRAVFNSSLLEYFNH